MISLHLFNCIFRIVVHIISIYELHNVQQQCNNPKIVINEAQNITCLRERSPTPTYLIIVQGMARGV